jgi:hypothetical protein
MDTPLLRKLILNNLINSKDNALYRFVWKYSEAFFTLRHHVNASWFSLIKLALFHRNKQVRGA